MPVQWPIRANGQSARLAQLSDAVVDIEAATDGSRPLDVVVFQEVMPQIYRKRLDNAMARIGFEHSSRKDFSYDHCTHHIKFGASGLVVYSRHPIIHQDAVTYDSCVGLDCIAAKGAVYCRVCTPSGSVFNVFATHLQAWANPESFTVRQKQCKALRQFIVSQHLRADEAVIIVGDLNTDQHTHGYELAKLLAILRAKNLMEDTDEETYSSDPTTNALVGNDDALAYANDRYPTGCYSDYLDSMSCPCCPRELLDYVCVSRQHRLPSSWRCRVVPIKARTPFQMNVNLTTRRTIEDLSDHYPVVAELVWNGTDLPFGHRPIRRRRRAFIRIRRIVTYAMILVLLVILALVRLPVRTLSGRVYSNHHRTSIY